MTRPELQLGLFSWELGKTVCYMSPLRKRMGMGGSKRPCVCVRVCACACIFLGLCLWSTDCKVLVLQQPPPPPSNPCQLAASLPQPALLVSEPRRSQPVREQGSHGLSAPVSPPDALFLHPIPALPLSWAPQPSGPPVSSLRKCSQEAPLSQESVLRNRASVLPCPGPVYKTPGLVHPNLHRH